MSELSKKQLSVLVTITALLAGGIMYNPDTTYVCESRNNLVADCDLGLSEVNEKGTQTVCKISTRSDLRCTEGWKLFEGGVVVETEENASKISTNANNCNYVCETENGEVNPYTKCFCGPKEGYLGELV